MSNPGKRSFLRSLFGGSETASDTLAQLPLHVPQPNSTPTDEESDPQNFVGRFHRQGWGALPLLKEVNRYLEHINQWRLVPERRISLTNIALGEVAHASAELYARLLDQGGGVPETNEQREGICEAVRAAERTAMSYKLVVRQDYASDDDRGDARRKRLFVCALRIMELARLEYILRAFRYQKFPTHAWRDCNQVFFAVRSLVDVHAKQALKIRLHNKADPDKKSLWPESGSIEELYISIQVMGLVDIITWPSHFMPTIADYVLRCEPQPTLLLTSQENAQDVVPIQHSVIFGAQASAPRLGHSDQQLGDSLSLDVSSLCDCARNDRQALLSGQMTTKTVADLDERDRLPFIDLLLKRIMPQQRRDGRKAVFDARHARVYAGFDQAYRLFRDLVQDDQEEVRVQREFWDALAEHTYIVQGERPKGTEPRWIVADESAGGVQLRMQENPYSAPLYVGQLLAYGLGEEPLADSKLGYVVRLHRTADMAVEVAFARIKGTVTAVMVEDLDALDQRTLPALLILHPDGGMALLCDNKHKFMTGDRLAVFVSPQHPHAGALGEPVLSKSDFTLFELHTSH